MSVPLRSTLMPSLDVRGNIFMNEKIIIPAGKLIAVAFSFILALPAVGSDFDQNEERDSKMGSNVEFKHCVTSEAVPPSLGASKIQD